jgi:calcineurin-like phosphoesterase family protein
MAQRTFAIGDIHGETKHLYELMSRLPQLDAQDTLVFLGDYIDRGPASAEVVEFVRTLHQKTRAKVVALRGNHEDAWLRVIDRGWDEFVTPPGNGCLAAYRSFAGGPVPRENELPKRSEAKVFTSGEFFPPKVVAWFRGLPYWYEDEHAIYVHAGLPRGKEGFLHPSAAPDPIVLLWLRDDHFFRNYRGKLVVFGHTRTEYLPPELSGYTPEDPTDLWAGENVVGIDTGCGNGGFLTALELPAMNVYESR